MSALDRISKQEIKELLSKGWLTHDAMWFASCYQKFGIHKTNELNLSAIALMSPFEVGRVRKAIRMQDEPIDTFAKLRTFVEAAMDLVLPEMMQVEFDFPEENVMRWKWKEGQCFAYKGLKRIGALDEYICGVMYRIQCWLNTLEIMYRLDPPVVRCLMHKLGDCSGKFLFDFGH